MRHSILWKRKDRVVLIKKFNLRKHLKGALEWRALKDLKKVDQIPSKMESGTDAIKKFTPSLGLPYLGV